MNPLNYSSRIWLYAPITVFLAIAVAVMIHWHLAAGAFEKKLAKIKGRDAAPGIVLDWDSVTVGGFPFRLDADFVNFSVHGAAARGPFVWKSQKFAVHALTYGRLKKVYEAAGPQHVEYSAIDGIHTADFLPGTMRGSSIADGRGLARFDLDVVDAGGAAFTARRMQLHMRRDPDGSDLDIMIKGDGVAAGAAARDVQAYVTLSNASALAGLLQGAAFWPDAVRAWHGQGGEVKLTRGIHPDIAARLLTALY